MVPVLIYAYKAAIVKLILAVAVSTYALVTASVVNVGVAKFVIF